MTSHTRVKCTKILSSRFLQIQNTITFSGIPYSGNVHAPMNNCVGLARVTKSRSSSQHKSASIVSKNVMPLNVLVSCKIDQIHFIYAWKIIQLYNLCVYHKACDRK